MHCLQTTKSRKCNLSRASCERKHDPDKEGWGWKTGRLYTRSGVHGPSEIFAFSKNSRGTFSSTQQPLALRSCTPIFCMNDQHEHSRAKPPELPAVSRNSLARPSNIPHTHKRASASRTASRRGALIFLLAGFCFRFCRSHTLLLPLLSGCCHAATRETSAGLSRSFPSFAVLEPTCMYVYVCILTRGLYMHPDQSPRLVLLNIACRNRRNTQSFDYHQWTGETKIDRESHRRRRRRRHASRKTRLRDRLLDPDRRLHFD